MIILIRSIVRKIKKILKLIEFKLFYTHKGAVKEKDIAIAMFGGLGDGVIALPFINQIIETHDCENVVVFCNKTLVQLFKDYTKVKEIIVLDTIERYSSEWIEFCKKLKGFKFAKFLDLNYSRSTVKNGYVVKNILADEKIGIKGDTINMLKPNDIDRYYTRLVDVENNKHENVNIYNFLKTVGYNVETDLYYLKKYVQKPDKKQKPYVIFAIGASAEYRIWPISKWVKVARYILDKTEKNIIVCGSEKEGVYYQKIQEQINSDRIINLCGKTALPELINLLGNCDFALANDSGPAHIVSSTGAKGVVLLGGGFNYRFFPHIDLIDNKANIDIVESKMECFGCKWICTSQDPFQCIKNIEVEEVLKKIEMINNK